MKHSGLTVVYAAGVRDATGVSAAPGAVLVQDGRVIAAGDPASLPRPLVERAQVIERPNDLILPAMVNGHTHLELTGIGPQPYDPDGGFVGWVKMVREKMPMGWLEASALQGAERSLASGIQAVGDIASSIKFESIRLQAGLDGVTYQELFGLGPPFTTDAWQAVDLRRGGLQPHAPYSAGASLYFYAAETGMPLSTHLAETPEEVDFVTHQRGPMLDYVKQLGRWKLGFEKVYEQGLTPVKWMEHHLETAAAAGGWLVAHCNYVSDDDIKILADTNTSVAYCPLASEYFGHQGHRYREMLAAGINVCLGTDSIVGTDPSDPQPLGLLRAMRRLYQRDGTDPETLLAMATINGARALRLDEKVATLEPGVPARLACVPIDPACNADPLEQVLTGQAPIEALSFMP